MSNDSITSDLMIIRAKTILLGLEDNSLNALINENTSINLDENSECT